VPPYSAIFDHYGDRIGRKATLITTLLIMGIGTALIGVLPGYAAIGLAAPLLLTVLRLLQGVAVGGEWGGSVLLAMEWGPRRRRGFMASWPQLGVPLGLLLSTALVQVMSRLTGPDFLTWGWRVPFLVSLLLVGVGLYVRLRVMESPEFAEVKERKAVARRPLAEVIRLQWRDILLSALVRMSEQAPFYLFITFVLTYGTRQLKLDRNELLTDTLIAAAVGLISVPLFGWRRCDDQGDRPEDEGDDAVDVGRGRPDGVVVDRDRPRRDERTRRSVGLTYPTPRSLRSMPCGRSGRGRWLRTHRSQVCTGSLLCIFGM
jgi:MFS family permease